MSTKRKTKEEFIADARAVHGDKYDYSKVEYVNQLTKVVIVCPEHGEFLQTPKAHLNGHGCRLCGNKKCSEVNKNKKKTYNLRKKYDTESFINEAKEIHGDKYDYSKVVYKNKNTPVRIICPTHGEFLQRPYEHLNQKSGCPECANKKRHDFFVKRGEDFVKEATELFNGKYDYDKVVYYNTSTKVIITCRKHGDFLCAPHNHLRGRGCPICKAEGFVYENRLYIFLLTIFNEQDIVRQYKDSWLSNNKSIDFYIPKYSLAIEHQGAQHVNPVKYLGGIEKHLRTIELDSEKYNECKMNGITILYFSYEKNVDFSTFIDKVYLNEKEFREKIIEIINTYKNEQK
jgi:hypothetical protein